jgi:tRNA(Phe) wybutosine-synthesizing methylase Tyw3
LHVACRSLEDAEKIYDKGKVSGWKKSGIIGMKNGFVVELNSSDKLEFPVISKNKILAGDEFLKIVVDNSNKKLEKIWNKIRRLEKAIK